jgi:Arc/MetJ-type ribon-helix-helix transcriptional regulator
MKKERITVSVDAELVAAGAAAVAEGRAESVSAWVNQALADRAARDRRLAALAEAVAAYEAAHGEIGPEELVDQARTDRDAAAGVRARAKRRRGAA